MTNPIVLEARKWLGTPWQHQGRLRGVGVDCAGLVIGVARDLGLSTFDLTDYGRRPDGYSLREVCENEMRRISVIEMEPGDVILIRYDTANPMHLAIIGDYPGGGLSLIHALAPARKVVETRLDHAWQSRIVRAYRLPGADAWRN